MNKVIEEYKEGNDGLLQEQKRFVLIEKLTLSKNTEYK